MAAYLGMAVHEFTAQYTRLTRERTGLSLTESEDGACIFLEQDGGCRVHAEKPVQCRTFPELWRFQDFQAICRAEQQKNNDVRLAAAVPQEKRTT